MKKNVVFFLTITAFFSTASAQDVVFFEGSWEELNAAAAAQNKYIMVDAYTDWCGPCKQMDKMMFHDNAEVAAVMNENFISYKIDCERDFGLVFSRKFKVAGYPTLLFFNSNGQLIDRQMGFEPVTASFVADLRAVLALDPNDTYQYDAKMLDMPWPDFYVQAFRDANNENWKYPKDADPNAFLAAQEDLTSEMAWAVMSRFNNIDEKYLNYFKENYKTYKRKYKKETENKIQSHLFNEVAVAASTSDEQRFKAALAEVPVYLPEDAEELAGWMMSYYYMQTKDWSNYASLMQKDIDAGDREISLNEINNTAWRIYLECEDQQIIKQAISWFNPYLNDMDDFNSMDTYASLLFKAGELEQSEKWAIKAIAVGEASGSDVSGTKDLLERITSGR
ncbi:MAG TPA: hypothetical protein DHW15_11640 [Bacteroidetes bacterium]|jgi:thiol-disulfide isomerase/thioredoxin|nr:MAG: hypothetical protein ABR94_01500 [Sphingobacteriales bacterium BACL12 MAG-120802-bin5]KRP10602.1 MAG: hypothetical protein ABR95_00750 [Sphingobacteriales bacterium BACL12 MAG-120813-bin55]HCK22777.1 hypothetical protein [Bacteroidota bacterium]